MTTGHVFIATSVDGFIARPDGSLDWLEAAAASGEDHGYETFMASIDGLIMGRATFETALGFEPWPYDRPVIVLSTTLEAGSIPTALTPKVDIAGSVTEAMARAAAQGWRRAYVDGGVTIRSFLEAGLIRDMVLTRVPVLLRAGRPLFEPLGRDIPLRHVETRSFPSGLVQTRYEMT